MRTRLVAVALTALVAAAVMTPIAEARGKKEPAPTTPGTYKEWGPDIDELEIVKSFKTSDYDTIAVKTLDTSSTPMPAKDDRSYDAVKSVLASSTETFTEAFRSELKSKAKVEQVSSSPKTAKTLLIRAKIEEISPGSRAKRYLAGYGAGAAGSKISGEVVDAKTGSVLARFTQERRSGGTWKFGGGGDDQVMRDSLHAIAQDVAHILDTF